MFSELDKDFFRNFSWQVLRILRKVIIEENSLFCEISHAEPMSTGLKDRSKANELLPPPGHRHVAVTKKTEVLQDYRTINVRCLNCRKSLSQKEGERSERQEFGLTI